MIIWGRALDEPTESKLDAAISAGFDPGEDYGDQPTSPTVSAAHARYVHQKSVEGCEDCGTRCDRCDDRMCDRWGPERRACGTTCTDCPCDCGKCIEAREDMRADLLHRIEGETG